TGKLLACRTVSIGEVHQGENNMQRDTKNCRRSVMRCSALVLALIMPTTILQAQSGQITPLIDDPNERTFVLTAQLHSYSDPGQNNVLGVLQIRLRQAIGDPNSFDAAGLAHLLQTQGPYVAGAIFDRSGAAVINFSRPDFLSTNTMFFTLATRISSS